MTTRIKDWGARPATTKTVVLIFTVTALITAGVVSWWTGGQIETERQGRGQLREENRKRDNRLSQRLVRIERGDAALCARSSACRRANRERRPEQRETPPGRREKREARKPEQVADRPPRQPSNPPTVRQPDAGGGDDPPDSPGTSAPSTPPSPSSPEPVVQVDPPAVDIDGPKGLLPQLLPDVNLPPVDVPPIRLP